MGRRKRNKRSEKKSKRDWSELPSDLLGLIAGRLAPMMEDYMAFRGVCDRWRSAAPKELLTLSKVPLLMLPQEEDEDGPLEREFYSLYKREICMTKPLPEAVNTRCTDVGFGWVLALADTEGTAFLFKPFSSAPRISLPSYKKFPGYDEYCEASEFYFITRGILTANPSDTSDFMLLASTNDQIGSGCWKNGAENWKEIPAPVQYSVIRRIDGMICTVFCTELPWVEIRDPRAADLSEPQDRKPVLNTSQFLSAVDDYYVVESTDGEVLLVTRYKAGGAIAQGGEHFGVKRVDIANGVFEEMQGLGKDAIFVGNNVAVSVDATEFPGVLKPGCIYFSDDSGTRYHDAWPHETEAEDDVDYIGIYNVEDRSIERVVVGFHLICPAMWIFPSFL